MDIYTVPYFYIIRHIRTDKKYVGCRFAKGCNPIEFFKPNGYFTSSGTIHNIIRKEGPDAFCIVQLIPEHVLGVRVYEYESRFLKENCISDRPDWLNVHNNDGPAAFGSDEFKERMFKIYGVDNVSRSEYIKDKKRETTQSNYGVDHHMQSERVKFEMQERYRTIHGVSHPLQLEAVRAKIRETCLEKYGVDNASKHPDTITAISRTMMENYGVEWAQQSPVIREKSIRTWVEKYGVDNPGKSPEVRKAMQDTCLEKYGETCYNKTQKSRQRQSIQRKGIIWFKNTISGKFKTSKSKTPEWITEEWVISPPPVSANAKKYICEHCGGEFLKCHLTRFHGDKCKSAIKPSADIFEAIKNNQFPIQEHGVE